VKAFRQGGEAALKARTEGRPQGTGKLKGWQAAARVTLVTDKEPRQWKRPFYLYLLGRRKGHAAGSSNRGDLRAAREDPHDKRHRPALSMEYDAGTHPSWQTEVLSVT